MNQMPIAARNPPLRLRRSPVGGRVAQNPTPTGAQHVANELEQAIRDNASQPAKAAVDGQSVEQHPLPDQIEADRYLASKEAVRKPGLGVKFAKIVPPGAE
jgi:hypothetical protein